MAPAPDAEKPSTPDASRHCRRQARAFHAPSDRSANEAFTNSLCDAMEPNTGFVTSSVRHQDRHRHLAQHQPRCAAKHELAKPRVSIAAHYDERRPERLDLAQDAFRYVALPPFGEDGVEAVPAEIPDQGAAAK